MIYSLERSLETVELNLSTPLRGKRSLEQGGDYLKRRMTNYLAPIIITVLALMFVSNISVHAQTSTQSIGQWQPPANFVNPVTAKVDEYKAMNMSDDQITAALMAQGMGWDPITGAAWMGVLVPPNQTNQSQVVDPFAENITAPVSSQTGNVSPQTSPVEADVLMGSSNNYMGGGNYMSCGSVATSSVETSHYVTMHLGKAYNDGTPCWCEVGVGNDNLEGGALYFYTYEGNTPVPGESGFNWICPINSETYQNAYCIELNGVQDQYGWQYNIWINEQWERSGHVQAQLNSVNFADEIFSTGSYTIDSINAHFVNSELYSGGVWNNWNSGASFQNSGNNPMPLSYDDYVYSNCYVYDAWTSQTT